MVLQRSRTLLALIAGLTLLLTISSVRVLSDLIAAHHTASGDLEGAHLGERGRFIGQTEANIGSHLPYIFQGGRKRSPTGAFAPVITFTDFEELPSSAAGCFTHRRCGTVVSKVTA